MSAFVCVCGLYLIYLSRICGSTKSSHKFISPAKFFKLKSYSVRFVKINSPLIFHKFSANKNETKAIPHRMIRKRHKKIEQCRQEMNGYDFAHLIYNTNKNLGGNSSTICFNAV